MLISVFAFQETFSMILVSQYWFELASSLLFAAELEIVNSKFLNILVQVGGLVW